MKRKEQGDNQTIGTKGKRGQIARYVKVFVLIMGLSVTLGACAGGCSLQKNNNPKTVENNKETDDMDVPTVTPTEALVDEMIAEPTVTPTVTPEVIVTEEPVEEISEEQLSIEVQMLNDVYNKLALDSNLVKMNQMMTEGNERSVDTIAAYVYGFNTNLVSDEARLQFVSQYITEKDDLAISLYLSFNCYSDACKYEVYQYAKEPREYSGYTKYKNFKTIPMPEDCLVEGATKNFDPFNRIVALCKTNYLIGDVAPEEIRDEVGAIIFDGFNDYYESDPYLSGFYVGFISIGLDSSIIDAAQLDQKLLEKGDVFDYLAYSGEGEIYSANSGKYYEEEAENLKEYIDQLSN